MPSPNLPERCIDCSGPLTPRGNCSRDILHLGRAADLPSSLARASSAAPFRIMVRSFEGRQLVASSAGAYWDRHEVWSTFTTAETREEAEREAAELRRGGVATAVVESAGYDTFCASHVIC